MTIRVTTIAVLVLGVNLCACATQSSEPSANRVPRCTTPSQGGEECDVIQRTGLGEGVPNVYMPGSR